MTKITINDLNKFQKVINDLKYKIEGTRDEADENNVLTSKQKKVLKLVSDGFSDKQIAVKLKICYGTVRNHINAINSSLGAENRAHSVAIGIRTGVIK